jgi:hypothetical protein
MIATVIAVRVVGNGVDLLSLHTRQRGADDRLRVIAEELWRERFGYPLPDRGPVDARLRLSGEGWTATVEPVEVEL